LSRQEAEKIARFRPHIQKTWWFFIAKFRKLESLNLKSSPENKLAPKYKNKINYDKSLQKKVFDFVKSYWWIELDPNQHFFVETSSQIYLTSPKWLEIKDLIHFERIWTPIFKKDKKWNIRPNHHFGSILGHLATKNWIKIDKTTAQKYALGNDLEKSEILEEYIDGVPPMWYVIIKYKKWWLWVGKLTKDGIKNKYIKS
jgi:NOL1/NOP2/fmu family ribosome biogenesis protein